MLELDLTEFIQQAIEVQMSEMHTSMPGKVVSYNASTNRAVVKPDLPKRIASGESLETPHIVEVPVIWPASGGGKASMTFPLQPGDGVMIAVQQRSLEGWLDGKNEMPDDPRQFDLSDSVAIPGCAPGGTVGHSDNVVMKFGDASLTLTPGGDVILANGKGSIKLDAGGTLTLQAQTIQINTSARNFVLEHHKHQNVQPGAGISGEPLP